MGYIYETNVIDWDKANAYINYSRIKRILDETEDDNNVAAVITIEEAEYVLKNQITPTPFTSPEDTLFGIGDFISNYAGNLYEAHRVTRIINEFRNFNIIAIEYTGPNGNTYIRLSGHPGVRAYLNATRYLADNPRILYMGVGTQGMGAVSAGATRFAIVFSLAYRVVELIFKEEYTLVDFFVNVTMDMAKLAVATQVTTLVTGSIVTGALTAGVSVIAVAVGVFVVGALIAYALYKLDDEYGISEAIIKALKSHRPPKPETPYHPDQFFTLLGRYSRG